LVIDLIKRIIISIYAIWFFIMGARTELIAITGRTGCANNASRLGVEAMPLIEFGEPLAKP
tara:strand:- start:54 stop:236 length:183 start_codon:yes stop_codon:yes gene_type:complete